MRKPLIAGNWKMNNDVAESVDLVQSLAAMTKGTKCKADILVCPPFVSLSPVYEIIKNTDIMLGAQNMFYEKSGAYTGEISPQMLKSAGVEYVILGHSERRQYFAESDETVNKKMKSAFDEDLRPILCVGESLAERENNEELKKVRMQLTKAYEGISKEDAQKSIVAYEPIWAIGTGRTASSGQAGEMATFIRETLCSLYGSEVAESILIQYGGSVKGSNISQIMAQKDVDGALVGGASLKADEFFKIVSYQE